MRTIVLAAVTVLLLGCASGSSQSLVPLVSGWETTFAIDWSPGEERGQRVVYGHIENRSGLHTKRIRLLVEALDNGRVVGQQLSWLGPDVPPGGRVYFSVPAPTQSSVYRVSVFDFDVKRLGADARVFAP